MDLARHVVVMAAVEDKIMHNADDGPTDSVINVSTRLSVKLHAAL